MWLKGHWYRYFMSMTFLLYISHKDACTKIHMCCLLCTWLYTFSIVSIYLWMYIHMYFCCWILEITIDIYNFISFKSYRYSFCFRLNHSLSLNYSLFIVVFFISLIFFRTFSEQMHSEQIAGRYQLREKKPIANLPNTSLYLGACGFQISSFVRFVHNSFSH